MSNFNRQIKGIRNTRRATECNTLAIQKILKEEAKIAVPLPTESVIDVYMKTRDETNPEKQNLNMLMTELHELLERTYPDRQKIHALGMVSTLSNAQLEEIGATRPGTRYPQYMAYDKYVAVNDAKIWERLYIEGKREQWINDQMMPRIKECMDTINMNIPLTNIITTSPNTHNANVQTRKNASISNRMKNLGNLFGQTPAANSTGTPAPRIPNPVSHTKYIEYRQQGGSRKTTRKQRRNRNRNRNRK